MSKNKELMSKYIVDNIKEDMLDFAEEIGTGYGELALESEPTPDWLEEYEDWYTEFLSEYLEDMDYKAREKFKRDAGITFRDFATAASSYYYEAIKNRHYYEY